MPDEPTPRRKRSENRRRHSVTAMRLLPSEREQLRDAAARRGISVSEFMRNAVLQELAASH